MRTDRELLELAAKAAGVVGEGAEVYHGILLTETQRNGGCDLWAPLDDEGDAFRLMVALNFEVEKSGSGSRFYVGRCGDAKWMEDSDDHWVGVDDSGAARNRAFKYAIVRAAAEIGAAM